MMQFCPLKDCPNLIPMPWFFAQDICNTEQQFDYQVRSTTMNFECEVKMQNIWNSYLNFIVSFIPIAMSLYWFLT